MGRFSHIARWPRLFFAVTFFATLALATGSAQAVVVSNSHGSLYGVAMVPGTGANLATAGVPVVTSGGTCQDPALASTPDLGTTLPTNALCLHNFNASTGDTVLPKNETFAMTWDPNRWGWATTRGDLEQLLRDIAAGSAADGTPQMTSPFSLTSQYTDALGKRAAYDSKYGGACIDLGNPGGYTCRYGTTNGSGAGNNYPTGANETCTPGGGNSVCLTDAAIQEELSFFVTTTRLSSYTQPGYSPLVVMMVPHGVEVCLDNTGKLCSVGGGSTAAFCSYHGYETINGVKVPYVVQPFSADTGCDEPNLPALPDHPTTVDVENDAATRIDSPMSAGLIASIVNPWLNGWYALDGSEINDNPYNSIDACAPEGKDLDQETVGSGSYYLQGEYNNGSALSLDLNALPCPQWAVLNPAFVAPSPINAGDVVMFDGSVTNSNEVVPKMAYWWSFGDGSSAVGPSVEHSYAKAGVYTARLITIDRGGNVNTLAQQVSVLGSTQSGGGGGGNGGGNTGLSVTLGLPSQNNFQKFLRSGLFVNVTSNSRADGIVRLAIPRAAALRAHLKIAKGAGFLIIGQGTVSGLIKAGKVTLHIRLSQKASARLRHLSIVKVTVKLTLHAPGTTGTKTFDTSGVLKSF
jgi:hypothetical protein